MSVITDIANAIGNLFGKTKSEAGPTTTTPAGLATPGSGPFGLAHFFQAETQRRELVQACRLMYKTDPRVQRMHRALARDLVRGGFLVKTDNEAARLQVEALQKRLGLNQKCEDYARLTARDGDSFLEIGVNGQMQIVEITRKPTLRMHRASNESDQFGQPRQAFWMAPTSMPFGYMTPEPPADALWFAEWQIIHARWNHDEESRYGSPMMESAAGAFKRVSDGELNMAIRRKTRAGKRYLHVVEGGEADLEAYRETNKAALENPFAAVMDLYSNKKGTVSDVSGDDKIGEIDDILHHIQTMGAASEVPLELVAYGNDLNRDVLGEKKAEYEESLLQGREWLSEQLIKPLIERQWLLAGIFPGSVDYSIIWRPRVQLTPTLIRDLADALLKLKLLQVSDADINAILAYFIPGMKIGALGSGSMSDTEQIAGMLKGLSI
jgi:hypothetical protein